MLPFGRCVLLWRLHQGLSQKALAAGAGIPQPNLSDIERGERDVSLRTLRALALALGIKPGLLADGVGPDEGREGPLSREKMERVAAAAAHGARLNDPQERELAERLRTLVWPGRRKGLAGQRAWLALSSRYTPAEVQSLLDRIAEKTAGPGGGT
jgi:transcriptional regulator with XRE-family HTH domain